MRLQEAKDLLAATGETWSINQLRELLAAMVAEVERLKALGEALLAAEERGADLKRALDHERTARLEAEALAERLQADWDSNAHVGAQALADLRCVQEAALDLVTCAAEAIRRADKAEERVAELEGLIADHEWLPEDAAALCPECEACAMGDAAPSFHATGCLWGQAAANHRARQPVEGRDFEWMP